MAPGTMIEATAIRAPRAKSSSPGACQPPSLAPGSVAGEFALATTRGRQLVADSFVAGGLWLAALWPGYAPRPEILAPKLPPVEAATEARGRRRPAPS